VKKDFIDRYTSNDISYQVVEDEFNKNNQGVQETIFTLGNGFIGSRGIMEEYPSGANPGTFMAGMYDISEAQVEELINLPNPIKFVISSEGEKLDIFSMKVLSHKRILDMKNGVLVRKTLYRDAKKRKFLYQSARFLSMADPHVGAMKVSIKLLNGNASLAASFRIDDAVYNAGGLMLAKRRHFNVIKADKEGVFDYIVFRTNTHKHIISYADSLEFKQAGKKKQLDERFHQFDLKTNQEIVFTKIFTLYTSYNYSSKSIKRETMRSLNESVKKGFDGVFKAHLKKMSKRWEDSDIVIEGDKEIQNAMRFNIYHMLISARRRYAHYSIGAKTLSGQGYRGHIFWDTEIYLLPFYIYTQPEIARGLLMFRYKTLPQAREIAIEKGYRGAMYPWEATESGTEQTPRYSKDVDGKIVEVHTQDYEHHITADVAFGVYNYYQITGDRAFLIDYGTEIIFETARFWASRVEYSKKDKKYHIRGVIGPDEFHVNVDDNAYTNYLAAWNLEYAVQLYKELQDNSKIKKILNNIKLSSKEVKQWVEIAENIVLLRSKKKKIINQFDGYLRKKDYQVQEYDEHFMPLTPKHLEFEGLGRSQLIKQGDVLLLFCLFPEKFSHEVKLHNYNFYLPRTTHKSSLSYCQHSILANVLGDSFKAFCFFWAAINIDLNDVPKNTSAGIHAANLGGVWQALLFGYAGLKCTANEINIDPKLPGNFKGLEFSFYHGGDRFEVEEARSQIKLRYMPKNNRAGSKRVVRVLGKEVLLFPYRYKVIKSEEEIIKMICVKDVMKEKNFVAVTEDTPVKEIGSILVEKKVSSVPVVDKNNGLKGIISESNIIKSTYDKNFEKLKAGQIMETNVISVNCEDSLEEITKIFTKYPYRRLPVIKNKKVVGVITRRDIIADFLGGYY
jgi:kojibiose phosphorylase